MSELYVQAVNLRERVALLSDGSTVPVTRMMDSDGDDTDDIAECKGFVCGREGIWFFRMMADYETVNTQ